MTEKNLYQTLSEEFENDTEYKIEYKILEITEQICSVMKEKQITRAELSRRLGTSKTAVTKMLDGNTNFTLKRLIKVADALEKELDILLVQPKKSNQRLDFNRAVSPHVDSAVSPSDMTLNIGGVFKGDTKDNLLTALY